MTNIIEQIGQTCRRYGVEIMYAFGSRANEIKEVVHGTSLKKGSSPSDADIGVKVHVGSSLSLREKVQLGMEFEDLLGINRIDLTVISEIDPFVAANVIRGERLFCEDMYQADEYELFILRRAGDLAHLEKERLRLIFHEQV